MSQRRQSPLFIRTKLSPPRLSRKVVHREPAMQALAMGATRALTLVKAPAGFGKTTLLTEWREILLGERKLVAWLTLDREDNDPVHFVDYLCHTLTESLGAAISEGNDLRQTAEFGTPKAVLSSLINALDRCGQEITLFLDDYDAITDPEIHGLMGFLLSHIPSNLHLVLASRSEPPFPVSSLRAHDQLVEIDVDAMRFEIEDTRAFFAAISQLKLSLNETRAIHDATEGWVTGLQIATIALRGRKSPSALITSGISGHTRAISAYLADNVLPQVPEETLAFMLRTSILDRLNGDLCNHVAGTADGEAKLAWLSGQNMFLQGLGDGTWYRYHALFADFLRAQLESRMAQELPALHERAAHWFALHEAWSEAVRHALAANRIDLATEWVERCAMREVEDSRVNNLLLWVRKLPESAIRSRPSLCIALGWALLLTMKLDQAQALLDDVESQVAAGLIERTRELDFELLALRFCQAALGDDMVGALGIGDACLERISLDAERTEGNSWAREAVLNTLTYCYRLTGQLEKIHALQPLLFRPWHKDVRNLFTLSYRTSVLSICDMREGRFGECEDRLRSVIAICEERAGRSSAAATLLACHLAAVCYERNDLDAVEELLADRLDIIDDACYLDSVLDAYLSLIRVAAARNDSTLAHALIDRAEAVGHHRGWNRLLAACAAERIRLWVRDNRVTEAERALRLLEALTREIAASNKVNNADVEGYLLAGQARVGRAQHRAAASLDGLADFALRMEQCGDVYGATRARILLLEVMADEATDRDSGPMREEVMRVCVAARLIRSVADEGRGFAEQLRASSLAGDPRGAAFIRQVIEATPAGSGETITAATATVDRAEVNPDLLSEREHDVLELVTKGLSNKQIAKALLITPETVKWHLKNIYGKLGVSGRTLAVHQAQKLAVTRSQN